MNDAAHGPPSISSVSLANLLAVNLLINRNLGASAAADRAQRAFSLLAMPPLLLLAGQGYKATFNSRLAGVVYVNHRRQSSYIFNLVTAEGQRRRGVARALLRHAAAVAREAQRRWLGLYVEAPNKGARRLYEGEGFRYYQSQGWRGRLPEPLPTAVVLQPASPWRERQLLKQYRDLELGSGDRWAATVVRADYVPKLSPTGRLFRCFYKQQPVGVLWARDTANKERLIAELFVDPTWWSNGAWRNGLLSSMAQKWGSGRSLDLFPGSGDHWRALSEPLRSAGFNALERHRLLMLKQLDGDAG